MIIFTLILSISMSSSSEFSFLFRSTLYLLILRSPHSTNTKEILKIGTRLHLFSFLTCLIDSVSLLLPLFDRFRFSSY